MFDWDSYNHMPGVHLQAVYHSLLDVHVSFPDRAIYFAFHHSCSLVQNLSTLSPSGALFIFNTEISFCWWLVHVGEHVILLISSHTIAVNHCMPPIFSLIFSVQILKSVLLFGLHCHACTYFSGLLGHLKLWTRKRIVHKTLCSEL